MHMLYVDESDQVDVNHFEDFPFTSATIVSESLERET